MSHSENEAYIHATSDMKDDFFINEFWTMFFGKKPNWSFYHRFGQKCDGACIWDGIVYHFINFRKEITVTSYSFNLKILAYN